MSDQDLVQLVDSIPEGQKATITITNLSGETYHIQGVCKKSDAPFFYFLCPGEILPATLDTSSRCPFSSKDGNGADVSFFAGIVEKPSNVSLQLIAQKAVQPEELRQFFRVALRTSMVIRYFPESTDSDQQEWEMQGETVDISQSGLLAILPAECRNPKGLDLEIALINPPKQVFCTGRVVRSQRLKNNRWRVSFHFDAVSASDRDFITKNCFAEQRRQLRDKGETY